MRSTVILLALLAGVQLTQGLSLMERLESMQRRQESDQQPPEGAGGEEGRQRRVKNLAVKIQNQLEKLNPECPEDVDVMSTECTNIQSLVDSLVALLYDGEGLSEDTKDQIKDAKKAIKNQLNTTALSKEGKKCVFEMCVAASVKTRAEDDQTMPHCDRSSTCDMKGLLVGPAKPPRKCPKGPKKGPKDDREGAAKKAPKNGGEGAAKKAPKDEGAAKKKGPRGTSKKQGPKKDNAPSTPKQGGDNNGPPKGKKGKKNFAEDMCLIEAEAKLCVDMPVADCARTLVTQALDDFEDMVERCWDEWVEEGEEEEEEEEEEVETTEPETRSFNAMDQLVAKLRAMLD